MPDIEFVALAVFGILLVVIEWGYLRSHPQTSISEHIQGINRRHRWVGYLIVFLMGAATCHFFGWSVTG